MSAGKHEKICHVRVFCSHPFGCSRLPSAVNDLATTNSKNVSSTSFHSTATMRYWKKKKKTNATFGIDEKGLV